MHRTIASSAIALATILAVPASAQDAAAPDNDVIEVKRQLLIPAAGLMNDHMHDGGEVMVGLRFERQSFSGANLSGSDEISDTAILAAGYTTRATSMEMDMVMLDLMYAPNDNLTLMVMPHYMWHRMEMIGIDPANTGMDHGGMDMGGGHGDMGGGHAHGGMPFGQTHEHGVDGFGDTLVSASYRLVRQPGFRAHATLGLWVPTGKVGRKNAEGSFVHYGMQSGSGTWDVEPAVTIDGTGLGPLGWGAQASYRWRTDDENASGFAFGDKAHVTGWLSYLLAADLGATARLDFEHEGQIEGHYNGPHNHSAPADRQQNYGGDVLSASLGLNWRLPVAMVNRPQLGVEVGMPLHQDLNGIQLPRDWRMAVSLAKTF